MKICIRCKENLELEKFYQIKSGRKKGNYYGECIICMNTRNIVRLTAFKVKAVYYLGGKCSKCGYNKSFKALDFHHLYNKKFQISEAKNTDFEKAKSELDKCVLLCANCHREEHHQEWLEKANFNKEVYETLLNEYLTEIYITLGKTKTEKPIFYCKNCTTNIVTVKDTNCIKCSHKLQEKIQWPSKEELEKLVWEKSRVQLSKELGVSDKAIAIHCNKLGISQPPRGYWIKEKYKVGDLNSFVLLEREKN